MITTALEQVVQSPEFALLGTHLFAHSQISNTVCNTVASLNPIKDLHKSFLQIAKLQFLGSRLNLQEEHKCSMQTPHKGESQFHGTDCNQISDTATKSQELALRRNYFRLGLSFKLQRLKDVWGNVRFSREQLILALTGATCHWIINTRPVLANIEV